MPDHDSPPTPPKAKNPFKAVGKIVGPYDHDQVHPGPHDPNREPRTRNQPENGESEQETAGNQNPGSKV
ncbi:hypothetical protein [Allopusillimonas ginsengisoli]|uniref:hypothetical protein n=1 Tax=Allopusillimonas ginsengisoli TaxID=453575 RepID=UPI00101F0CE3|nr:hypothetical protein [Allopusillimonas ginsengisoli]TEA77309.1 hypothetical protein ERE07_15275 [Allopusillimonas ginsengisoli]